MRAPRSPRQPGSARARVQPRATPKPRCLERALLRLGAGAVLALFASVAAAQISGTVNLVSDYRYRGTSLSDDKPAAQLGLTYDDASGWYAGLSASTVRYAEPSEH